MVRQDKNYKFKTTQTTKGRPKKKSQSGIRSVWTAAPDSSGICLTEKHRIQQPKSSFFISVADSRTAGADDDRRPSFTHHHYIIGHLRRHLLFGQKQRADSRRGNMFHFFAAITVGDRPRRNVERLFSTFWARLTARFQGTQGWRSVGMDGQDRVWAGALFLGRVVTGGGGKHTGKWLIHWWWHF